jgi:hypothetical protein
LTNAARAGEPFDDRLGIRTVPLYLLMRSDVQADLKLDPNQISDSARAASRLYNKALSLRGKLGSGIVAARRAVDEDQSQFLSTHLSPQQLERLGQIELQWEGAGAMLSRPVVGDYLSLTLEQHEKVARLVAEARSQRAHTPWTPTEHVNLTRKAISVLSDKQRELWIHVLGPPCRFAITARPQVAPDQPAASPTPARVPRSGR